MIRDLLVAASLVAVAVGCSVLVELPEPTGNGGASPGGGGAGGCAQDADCVADNPCTPGFCVEGVCKFVALDGVDAPDDAQADGDCRQLRCVEGLAEPINDDGDVPDDGTICTDESCSEGIAQAQSVNPGQPCEANGVCDAEGECVGCNVPQECPGEESACTTRTCVDNVCGEQVMTGLSLPDDAPGDCHEIVCSATGMPEEVIDTSDVPVDNNDCTDDLCQANGNPSNPPVTNGSSCGVGLLCAGSTCVGCITPADCGSGGECFDDICDGNGECSTTNEMMGFILSAQTPEDCVQRECDGMGQVANVPIDDPVVDNNACTDDICNAGTPSNPNKALNTSCGGGNFCDGLGSCVECNGTGQCGPVMLCQQPTCINNVCGVSNTANGTPAPAPLQTSQDCQVVVCDGAGSTLTQADPGDPEFDSNICTSDVCVGSSPSHPPLPEGFDCSQDSTGLICDGNGACVDCIDGRQCTVDQVCAEGFCQ
jgi:hypothetical protein